jgi:hypothetical protein
VLQFLTCSLKCKILRRSMRKRLFLV